MNAVSPGLLRRRIAIEQPADVADGAGGVARAYAPLAQAFAEVEPLTAEQAERGRALGLRKLWRVTIRARGDVTGGCRVAWRERTLDVLAVRALAADDRFEEMLCEEIVP